MSAPEQRVDLSVVVPCFEAQTHLEAVLQALAAQPTALARETIVVDCSTHDGVEAICRRHPEVIYHREKEHFFPGGGRNIGAALSRGRLLVFLDADVVLAPEALANAWLHYCAGNSVFGGAIVRHHGSHARIGSHLEHGFFNSERQPTRGSQERQSLSGAVLAMDADLFRAAGEFVDFPRSQDTELSRRLIRRGSRLMFFPDVVGEQFHDTNVRGVLRKAYIDGWNHYAIDFSAAQSRPLPRRATQTGILLAVPALAAVKSTRIVIRTVRFAPSVRTRVAALLTTPLVGLAGLAWSLGLGRAALQNAGVHAER